MMKNVSFVILPLPNEWGIAVDINQNVREIQAILKTNKVTFNQFMPAAIINIISYPNKSYDEGLHHNYFELYDDWDDNRYCRMSRFAVTKVFVTEDAKSENVAIISGVLMHIIRKFWTSLLLKLRKLESFKPNFLA